MENIHSWLFFFFLPLSPGFFQRGIFQLQFLILLVLLSKAIFYPEGASKSFCLSSWIHQILNRSRLHENNVTKSFWVLCLLCEKHRKADQLLDCDWLLSKISSHKTLGYRSWARDQCLQSRCNASCRTSQIRAFPRQFKFKLYLLIQECYSFCECQFTKIDLKKKMFSQEFL